MSITFHNPGEIDIRGATIAGLSAKTTDSAIGFFGTGLKYGIACVLRWGGEITIHSGTEAFRFAAEEIDFRGQAFKQITMNGSPLGFTTEYGKKWEPWQVFREFYANALDEGGDVCQGSLPPRVNETIIVVTCKELEDQYGLRDSIILPNRGWTIETPQVRIMDTPAEAIYFKGVRVAKATSRVTWNFMKHMDLTEDRSLKGIWQAHQRAGSITMMLTDKSLITSILNASTLQGLFEAGITYNGWCECTDEFLDVAAALYKSNPRKFGMLKDVLTEKHPEAAGEQRFVLTSMQEKMLRKARRLVRLMGVEDAETVNINLVDFGKETMGMCKNGEIYLCPPAFRMGTKQLVATLFEELLHRDTGLVDLTYEMQNYLFDRLVGMYEEHVFGEPC